MERNLLSNFVYEKYPLNTKLFILEKKDHHPGVEMDFSSR